MMMFYAIMTIICVGIAACIIDEGKFE